MTTLLHAGLHPDASDALRACGVTFDRITQALSNPDHPVAASAGTHDKDGEVNGHAYSAATDLRITDLSQEERVTLFNKLANIGFAVFDRIHGHNWSGVTHCHCVFSACPLKHSLRNQIHSYVNGRDGLVGNAPDNGWLPTDAQKQLVRTLFLAHNPMNG